MGKLCSKCGMESDRNDICTWCNADLEPPKKAAQAGGASKQAATPGAGAAAAPRPSVATPGAARTRRAPEPEPEPIPQGRPPWVMPVAVGGGGLLLLVGGLLYMGIAASGPPAEPGEKWESIVSREKSFAAYYPTGWGEPSNSGSAGSFVSVVWKGSKLARVSVDGSSTAGSIGDTAAAAERMAGGAVSIERTADGALLEFFKNQTWLSKHPDYDETGMQYSYAFAKTKSVCTEYTCTKKVGLLPVKMKGMRWASQQGDYGYHVVAECPEQHWEKFRPTALQILGHVQLGGGF